MRTREGLFLLVGAGLVAGLVLVAKEVREGGEARPGLAVESMPPPAQSPVSRSKGSEEDPARTERAPGRAAAPVGEDLKVQVLSLELKVQRLLLARAGGDRAKGERRLELHPFATKSMEELSEARGKADQVVQPLLARWRAAAPGEERATAMKELATPMMRLLEAGGSMEHLLTLEESAERGETVTERKWAVIATHTLWHPQVVDYLLARAQSPHVEVRFYAVEGLAWVRGDGWSRAIDGVVRGLDDPDASVRQIAACSLGVIAEDPQRAGAVLDRLRFENDPEAAAAMAAAVLRLDPTGGRARVEAAAAASSGEVRAAVGKALAAKR